MKKNSKSNQLDSGYTLADSPVEVLLAIVLSSDRTGYVTHQQGRKILSGYDYSISKLLAASHAELMATTGLSRYQVLRLQASQELAARRQVEEVLEKPKISRSQDVYQLFSHLKALPYEEFWIVVLNRANRVIDVVKISEGGLAGTVVDIRRILHSVLMRLGTSIILAHNHPSGNLIPSQQDIEITKRISEAGRVMDIEILDHVIVAETGYYSFEDNGII